MKKSKLVLLALLAAVFLFSVGMMARQQLEYQKIAADSEEAARIAGLPVRSDAPRPTASAGTAAPAPPEPDETEAPPEELPVEAVLAGIDLEALRAVNGDVMGWIEIPGTELSYPLVQGRNNRYYLSRSWKKEPSAGGAVFLESTNSGDLTDFHTIIYGHRMNNESMFGPLKHYKDPDFWREHPSVYLATEAGVYRYDIFAAQEAGVRELVYRLDLETSHLEEEFLQYCVENSAIDTGIVPTASDRILTLSTCTASNRAKRWVVHGVLAQVYEGEAQG